MKFFKWLKRRWLVWAWKNTPTCKEMSQLSSQSLEQPLNRRTRAKMLLHFKVCVWCERYFKHLRFIHKATPCYEEKIDQVSNRKLSDEAKQRMKAQLKETK